MTRQRLKLSELKAAKRMGSSKNENDPPTGTRCPDCGCGHAKVYRTSRKTDKIVRVRVCRYCGRRYYTTERVTG